MIKIIIINFLLNLYYLTEFDIILKIIQLIGGTLFIKLFQSYNNLKKLKYYDVSEGSIGDVEIKKNIVTKTLKQNIYRNFNESFDILSKIIQKRNINIPFYIYDFYQINIKQLNLINEKENSIKLIEIFKNIDRVKVIEIMDGNLISHKSKFIKGYNIDTFLKINKSQSVKMDVYRLLNLSYYLMLSCNFFHCDWHDGNFLFNFNKNNQVVLYILDLGLVGKLENKDHHNKLKVLLRTNMLRPEPINMIKFLAFINLNKKAQLKNFVTECKEISVSLNKNVSKENYKKTLIKLIENASKNKLKLPIVIFYMFQAIIFLNNHDDKIYNNILDFSRKNGFYSEIEKYLNH